ncbi:hypothetical protein [Bradyrhizobium sp. RDI18]|uniref:AMP-binding enzyme n=1 Tax=Bradyrhizobium sp. RDI18 TaxID=3367400 RepID=UPI00371211BE
MGYPHDLKGQGIYCYVTLNTGENGDDALKKDLVAHVRREIGPIASPDLIQFSPGLPKTRSGKIMRRILRKIAEDDYSSLGHIDPRRSGRGRRPHHKPSEPAHDLTANVNSVVLGVGAFRRPGCCRVRRHLDFTDAEQPADGHRDRPFAPTVTV